MVPIHAQQRKHRPHSFVSGTYLPAIARRSDRSMLGPGESAIVGEGPPDDERQAPEGEEEGEAEEV